MKIKTNMNWILVAIIAYFFLALAFVVDKLLLSERIPKPSVYAFYVAVLSAVSIVLMPFGFHSQIFVLVLLSFVSGAIFVYALLFYYIAAKENEISRVAPLVWSVAPIITLVFSASFFGENFSNRSILGVALLVVGGLLISFDLPIKSRKIFSGFRHSIISGVLFAIAYVFFKEVYDSNTFINGFIWTRMGIVLGGLSLFIFPNFRREIVQSFSKKSDKKKKEKRKSFGTAVMFIGNKVIGGTSSVLINYAIYSGSTTVVHAMSSTQFVFVLILAGLASIKYPKIFREKLGFWDWAQKVLAIMIIAGGIFLISK